MYIVLPLLLLVPIKLHEIHPNKKAIRKNKLAKLVSHLHLPLAVAAEAGGTSEDI